MLSKRLLCKVSLIQQFVKLSSRMASLRADPPAPLVDDKTKFVVEGLSPGQDVTLAASITEGILTVISHAHYRADTAGRVDLTQQESLGGSYTGQEPMGLMWAMEPQRGSRVGSRLVKKDVSTPLLVKMSVLPGHQNIEAAEDVEAGSVICHLEHPRTYMAPGVTRTEIKEGRLRGALYLPKGDGPFPGVIDMFGTAGGLMEFRSALLASRGFASYALPLFAYADLKRTQTWDMEYFEDAVDWLNSHPSVLRGGIGIIATSKGTELAHYMAISKSQVKAVVSINGYYYYSYAEHYKNGALQPTVTPDWQYLETDPEGIIIRKAYIKATVPPEAMIPIEKAEGAEFLFLVGEDDACSARDNTDILVDRLKKHGKNNYEAVVYPGAGHLIEPPYTANTRTAFHKVFQLLLLQGGNPMSHAVAQEDSWRRILKFFNRRLVENVPQNNYTSRL